MPGLKRIRYSEGQVLSAKDFIDEQTYFLEKQRRHNRALHGTGIIHGLEVRIVGDAIRIEPGLALDANGNEIMVDRPVTIRIDESTKAPLYVVIQYAEIECDPLPVVTPIVATTTMPSRVEESFEVRALPEVPKPGRGPCACPLLLARLSYRRGRWHVDRAVRAPRARK